MPVPERRLECAAMRWTRWLIAGLAVAAACCLAVAAGQWYVRNYGTNDLVCRGPRPAAGAIRDCLDTRPSPVPLAVAGAVLSALAMGAWLGVRRASAATPSRHVRPSGT